MKFYNDKIDISVELWNKIITDTEIIDEKVLDVFLFLLDCDRCEGSGSEIAWQLNYSHHAPLNAIIPNFSKRILKKYPEIEPPKRKNGEIRYWHIPFLGNETKNYFSWILRNELKEALLNNYSEKRVNVKLPEDFLAETVIFIEGKNRKYLMNVYERNPKARDSCLKHYGYKCQICSFDFEKIYGSIGKGIIHVHHLIKISDINEEYEIDPIKDLIPICPNCHTVIHSKKEMFNIDEIKELIKVNKNGHGI